ncbi:hypothetical protein CK203_082202 [Vitis vinifera]|uniref:Uncharacterized protein n=1 Tax=Vitis vinifera TaxID=29760 RepID=A0A438CN96_VITVI|nr:hypothetical protein CK203_082202 [Vitis vinifera]
MDEASAEGTVERRWAGGPADLVGGGRESSPISMVNCGSGLAGLSSGPSCGPSALSCGEAQDLWSCKSGGLGWDPRPSPLSFKRGCRVRPVGLFKLAIWKMGPFMETRPQSRFLGLGFCSRLPYPGVQVKMQEEKPIPSSGCRETR